MRRYLNNRKARGTHGKNFEHYRTNIYPKIERHTDDIYIITRMDDRLDIIAWEYYKDVTLWWVIAEANGIGKGGLMVEVGKQIRIPSQLTMRFQMLL